MERGKERKGEGVIKTGREGGEKQSDKVREGKREGVFCK